jgi:hypothetical protein
VIGVLKPYLRFFLEDAPLLAGELLNVVKLRGEQSEALRNSTKHQRNAKALLPLQSLALPKPASPLSWGSIFRKSADFRLLKQSPKLYALVLFALKRLDCHGFKEASQ